MQSKFSKIMTSVFEKPEQQDFDPKEARALSHLKSFMSNSRRYCMTYFDKFDRLWGEYLNTRQTKSSPLQRANLKLPYAWTIVEQYVPQVCDAFLREKPYIEFQGRMPEDMQWEDTLSQFVSFQMDQMSFYEKFVVFNKDLSVFGTAVAKVPWKYQEKTAIKKEEVIDEATGKYKRVAKKTLNVLYDGPDFDPIPIWDFFPDWTASQPGNVQAMRGCVLRVWRTLQELDEKRKVTAPDGSVQGIYVNLDKLRMSLKDRDSNKDDWSVPTKNSSNDFQTRDQTLGLENGIKRKDKMEVWEYWGLFDATGNGDFQEYVITVANGSTVIRCETNPYDSQFKPFVASVNYPVSGEFYGVGDIEPVLSLIREGSALRNARLDNANLAVNRMWLIDRSCGINPRSLYSRAGGAILTNDINGIKALDVAEVPGSSYNELSQIDYDIQNATAQINSSQNASNLGRAFGRTATGVSYLQSNTNSRINLKVKLLENLLMKPLGKMFLMLNRQFLSNDQFIRVMNDTQNPFKVLPSDSFWGDYDFSAMGAVDRLSEEQQAQNFGQNVVPFLESVEKFNPGTINWNNLTKQYLKVFNFRDPYQLINPPQVQQQIQQQMQQAQMQQQMQLAEHNAQTQAQAQAMLSDHQHQNDLVAQGQSEDAKLQNEVVKGVFNSVKEHAKPKSVQK